jgi:hypothetical protein
MIYTDEGILRFLSPRSYRRVATRIIYSKNQANFKLIKYFKKQKRESKCSYEAQRQRDYTFDQLRAIGWDSEEANDILKRWMG